MKEVSREEFYSFILPRDITVYTVRTKPIVETEFRLRGGIIVGKATTDFSEGLGVDKYYLIERGPND